MQSQNFIPVIPMIGGQWQTLFPLGQTRMLQDMAELQAHVQRPMQVEINIPPSPPSPDETLVFDQLTPSALWTINHNTGQFPSVTIVDGTGGVVYGTVRYVNSNQITISFSAPFSGRAFLNV